MQRQDQKYSSDKISHWTNVGENVVTAANQGLSSLVSTIARSKCDPFLHIIISMCLKPHYTIVKGGITGDGILICVCHTHRPSHHVSLNSMHIRGQGCPMYHRPFYKVPFIRFYTKYVVCTPDMLINLQGSLGPCWVLFPTA